MPKKEKQPASKDKNLKRKISYWLNLVIYQSILSIIWLLLIPREPGNAIILGYSLRRLALIVPMVLPLLVSLILRWLITKNTRWEKFLDDESFISKIAAILVGGGFLLSGAIWSFAFLFHFMKISSDLGAYMRLLPMLVSFFLTGLEMLLFPVLALHPVQHNKKKIKVLLPTTSFLVAFALLLLGLIIIAVTGWGIDPERVSIITLGVPLLEGQIWYVAGLLILILVAVFSWTRNPKNEHESLIKRADPVFMLSLWLFAVVLWMSLPLPKNNYFAPPVQAPNFEKYPFSDAEQYDFDSLNVYFGSLEGNVISKPLYVTFLTVLHSIAGLSYDRVIFLQTLIVALFPVVLYLIGKELHSRIGGIAIALFAIMREVTAIQATSMANVSSTKLLLSDMPAALLASILALILIRWFKSDSKKVTGHEFFIGGLIGTFILTRIQTMVLVPFALMLVIIRYFRNLKTTILSALILLLAVGLVVAPVLIRNHSITGVYWVDNPSSSQRLYTRFIDSSDEGLEIPDATTKEEILNRNLNIISTTIKTGLGGVLNFVFDNFTRNEISSFLVLPVRLGNQVKLVDFMTLNEPFWVEVYSIPNLLNGIVILANIAMLALGFSKAFRKNSWSTLVILGFHIIYSLSSALARLSGWRFILPVDWVIYLFYALGLVEGLIWIFQKILGWNLVKKIPYLINYPAEKKSFRQGKTVYALFGILFVLTGSAIPLREKLLPSLLPDYSRPGVCQILNEKIKESGNEQFSPGFPEFCNSSSTRVLYGYGIYPRFFGMNEGYYDRSYDPWYGRQPYTRLVFRLIGKTNGKIYIKTGNDSVQFPNGSMVYVVGEEKNKFEAQVVFIEGEQPELLISSEIISGQKSFETLKN